MPLYDYSCPSCQQTQERCVPYEKRDIMICEECSAPLTRIWSLGTRVTIIPDSIPGGQVIENLTPQPKRYYSRSEIRLAAEMANSVPFVRHVGEPGSDKSKFTSRWV